MARVRATISSTKIGFISFTEPERILYAVDNVLYS